MPLFAIDRGSLKTLAGLTAIMLVVIFCAWPGMHSPLFTDDVHQLEKTKNMAQWTEIFGVDVFNYYRPVKNALFALAAPFATNLVAWHWIGLTAYLGATAGVLRIALICLKSRRAALMATCFWALSPSCVSTAIWVSCANISIGVIFAACLFQFHERWAERPSFKWMLACGMFYALTLLCYESLIAFPGILFVRDFQQHRLRWNRQTVIRYGGYTLVALAFLLVRHHFSATGVGGAKMNSGFSPDTKAIQMSLSAPWFLWRHFLMWIFPFGTLEILGSYAWLRSASIVSLVFGWIFMISTFTSAVLTWKRFPQVAFGVVFFVVASFPSGNFIPCFNGPIYDAYVTIPSIGLALALALACENLICCYIYSKQESKPSNVMIAVLVGLLLIYRLPVCGGYFRYWATVWGNPLELMLLTAETRPLQYQAKGFTSILLLNEGYADPAQALALETLSEAPWLAAPRLTLARLADYRGDSKTAEERYRQILSRPELAQFVLNIANIELARILVNDPKQRDEAAQLCRDILSTQKNSQTPQAVDLLATIYRDKGMVDKARVTLERGLTMYPENMNFKSLLNSLDKEPTKDQTSDK